MRRFQLTVVVVGLGVAFGAEAGAQHVALRRIGVGLDYVVAINSPGIANGTFFGPTIGGEFASQGPLRLRADASVQAAPWSRHESIDVPDGGGAFTIDARPLRVLGTATVALEAGTSERFSSAGLFVAARLGGGVGHWGGGRIYRRYPPAPDLSYRENGYTRALLVSGVEVGMWVPAYRRAHRVALRIDAIHGPAYFSARTALVLFRH